MRQLLILLLVAGLSTAQAAEATPTLACQGTTSSGRDEQNPQSVSLGIIVNFKANTDQGFVQPGKFSYPVKITGADDVIIAFEGHRQDPSSMDSRVTGDLWAMAMERGGEPDPSTDNHDPLLGGRRVRSSTNYKLKCSPTQRKF
jgi:hypothetical protein